jgi:hypothetical protein
MEESFRWFATAAAAILILLGLDRVGLWMEDRGWLYYRRVKPSSTNLGSAFLELQSLLEPSKKHVLESRLEERDEETDSGDPPEPGQRAAVKRNPRRASAPPDDQGTRLARISHHKGTKTPRAANAGRCKQS